MADRSTMPPREEWNLDTHHIGRRVLVFDRIDSTNTQAAALAHDASNDGLVLLADEQTAGRGRQDRPWKCPRGTSVLLSVLLFPRPAVRRPVLLAAWVANSVCETILQVTGLEAQIKWPNDVLMHGRKVCGILIEQGCGTVVGLGLNVNQTERSFAEAGLLQAGSLAQSAGRRLDRQRIARLLIAQLDDQYERLQQEDFATLQRCWKQRLGLLGKQVVIEGYDRTYHGRLRELAWDGIDIESFDGKVLRIAPEVIKHIIATRITGGSF